MLTKDTSPLNAFFNNPLIDITKEQDKKLNQRMKELYSTKRFVNQAFEDIKTNVLSKHKVGYSRDDIDIMKSCFNDSYRFYRRNVGIVKDKILKAIEEDGLDNYSKYGRWGRMMIIEYTPEMSVKNLKIHVVPIRHTYKPLAVMERHVSPQALQL